MEFGKVPASQLDRIRFALPPEHLPSLMGVSDDVDSSLTTVLPQVYVGCPVWSEPRWVGKIYPPKTRSKDFVQHYVRQFNTIELNASFYRIPDSKTIAHWREISPNGFRFCPKVFQAITHEKGLVGADSIWDAFCESFLGLGNLLGPAFLQLPPDFARDRFRVLKEFLKKVPSGMRLAVEFRHPSWFLGGQLLPQAFELLEENRALAVITDVAGRRDSVHTGFPSGILFVRFVGNDMHPTDFSRIDEWIQRLGVWFKAGLKQVYFFIHEPDNVRAPELVQYFVRRMNHLYSLNIAEWEDCTAPAEQDAQLSLF